MSSKATDPEGGDAKMLVDAFVAISSKEVDQGINDVLHPIFGMDEKNKRNATRKLNNLLKAYDYEYKGGSFVSTAAAATATKSSSKRAATPAAAADDDDVPNESPTKKAKSTKATKPASKDKVKGKAVKTEPKLKEEDVKDESETSN